MSFLSGKRGRIVVFLGPDGAGKSTLVSKVYASLERQAQVKDYYFAPGFLRRYRPKPYKTTTSSPHEGAQYSQPVALAKILLFLLEFRLGTAAERRKYDTLLFDRFIHDVLVDPLRYRLGASKWWMRVLLKLAPQPDLAVIVTGNPQDIQRRKSEVTYAETARQLDAYRKLAESFKRSLIVDNTGDADAIARHIFQQIEALC